ncbi:MAG: type II toxin-antitoxin system HicA family toxin [bacterium]|jgi:predicted RNA binding protein YcfA (HicA-like mRNA interferase family)
MTKIRKLLEQVLRGSGNVSFADVLTLLDALGFRLARKKGSHHIFRRAGVNELINIQNFGGKIKTYQLRQLVSIIERYGLDVGDGK